MKFAKYFLPFNSEHFVFRLFPRG